MKRLNLPLMLIEGNLTICESKPNTAKRITNILGITFFAGVFIGMAIIQYRLWQHGI